MTENEEKQLAAETLSNAWAKAVERGVSSDLMAATAISAALTSLVAAHGREAAVRMLDRFATASASGKFDHNSLNEADGVDMQEQD